MNNPLPGTDNRDVQAALVVGGRLDCSPDLGGVEGIGDEALDVQAFVGEAALNVTEPRFGAAHDRDHSAVAGQQPGGGGTDPAASAGDDGPTARKLVRHGGAPSEVRPCSETSGRSLRSTRNRRQGRDSSRLVCNRTGASASEPGVRGRPPPRQPDGRRGEDALAQGYGNRCHSHVAPAQSHGPGGQGCPFNRR